MATAVYTLAINEDGTQHTAYPAGDKPGSLVAPDSLTATNPTTATIDLNWNLNSSGHTGQDVAQWIQGVSTSWEVITSLGANSRFYQAAGLPAGAHIGHKVRSTNGAETSAWSLEAWQDTATEIEPGVGLIFQDSFSTYSVGDPIANKTPPVAAAGARWTWTGGSDIVVGTGGRSGNCLHFEWVASSDNTDGTTDPLRSRCEQHLKLCDSASSAKQEVWLEFYLNASDMARAKDYLSNDKFVSMLNANYCEGGSSSYGRLANVFNTWGIQNDRYGTFSPAQYNEDASTQVNFGHNHEGGGVPPYGPGYLGNKSTWHYNWQTSANYNAAGSVIDATQAADAGVWVRHRLNCRINDLGQPNGHMKWWRDNDLILDVEQIYQDFKDGYNRIDGMYLLGSFNSGMLSATTWKMDDISIWDVDPNWSFS